MAGRALAFSNPELIRLASDKFVPVVADDWYQRRRDDAEGKFFRAVADQGPRKGAGGGTRQGIYCFTASGKLLAYKNAGQLPDVMLDTLKKALREWDKLPADQRKPGAVKVPAAGKADARYARTPPEGGLILKGYTRILDKDGKGSFKKGTCETPGGDAAARDHVWLTKAEWQGLVPADPKKGDSAAVPKALAERLLRFHLLDNTRGEPNYWKRDEVRKHALTWTVTDVSDKEVRMRLDGSALLATAADAKKADRGFDVALLGYLHYDRAAKKITRLDLLAVGEHWGECTYTRKARPGRQPLGVAFELADGTRPADRVPPQAAREVTEYFRR